MSPATTGDEAETEQWRSRIQRALQALRREDCPGEAQTLAPASARSQNEQGSTAE